MRRTVEVVKFKEKPINYLLVTLVVCLLLTSVDTMDLVYPGGKQHLYPIGLH